MSIGSLSIGEGVARWVHAHLATLGALWEKLRPAGCAFSAREHCRAVLLGKKGCAG